MDFWNILFFGIIPALTVCILFFVNRKRLWLSPLISTPLAAISHIAALYAEGMHAPIAKLFSNHEWRGFFFLALLLQLGITVVLTVIAYFAACLLKRKQK